MLRYLEFFAGGGMVRAGLGSSWTCVMANDFDRKKSITYRDNWGSNEFIGGDIRNLSPDDMKGEIDLAWGSFPCQDLSLAGGGAGLRGNRSGTFWPFISHMKELSDLRRAPKIITLENVLGTLSSHKGSDFRSICIALHDLGYRIGAVVVDAVHFVPQSRPRLFVVAVHASIPIPSHFHSPGPQLPWQPDALVNAVERLPSEVLRNWKWWKLPPPTKRDTNFIDLIEDHPTDVQWHTPEQTEALLGMMSPKNLAKVGEAKKEGKPTVGGVYKRTRYENGQKIQRAEVRFDKVAGCLRTPSGGSSRQLILWIKANQVRSRLLSARETARLMGLSETYKLPVAYNEAYHLTGDGVAVPVVSYLARNLFEPIVLQRKNPRNDKPVEQGSDALRT